MMQAYTLHKMSLKPQNAVALVKSFHSCLFVLTLWHSGTNIRN